MLKWLDNFWYHHKWATIITAFFLIVAVFCCVQIFTKTEYDACVMFVGAGGNITNTQYNDIVASLETFAEDTDGDGKLEVCFSRETFISDRSDEMAGVLNSNISSTMQTLLYQDYFILLLDPELYNMYKDSGMFVTLASHGIDAPANAVYDEYAIRLSECDAYYKMPGLSAIPSDTLLVLKTVPYMKSQSKTEKLVEMQADHARMIKKIVSFVAPES